jgi:hypothetical protein
MACAGRRDAASRAALAPKARREIARRLSSAQKRRIRGLLERARIPLL